MSNVEVAEEETARGAFLRFDIRHSAFDIRHFLSAANIGNRDEKREVVRAGRVSTRRGPQAVRGAAKCCIETQHGKAIAAWSRYVRYANYSTDGCCTLGLRAKPALWNALHG